MFIQKFYLIMRAHFGLIKKMKLIKGEACTYRRFGRSGRANLFLAASALCLSESDSDHFLSMPLLYIYLSLFFRKL